MTAQINRYFLFTYRWESPSQFGTGNLWFESARFPSNKHLKSLASKNSPVSPEEVVITGWNEFRDEDDYLAFIDSAYQPGTTPPEQSPPPK